QGIGFEPVVIPLNAPTWSCWAPCIVSAATPVTPGATVRFDRSIIANIWCRVVVPEGVMISAPNLTGCVVSSATLKNPTVSHTAKTLLLVVNRSAILVSNSRLMYGCVVDDAPGISNSRGAPPLNERAIVFSMEIPVGYCGYCGSAAPENPVAIPQKGRSPD